MNLKFARNGIVGCSINDLFVYICGETLKWITCLSLIAVCENTIGMANVTTLTFLTNTELSDNETPFLRGAVIRMAGEDSLLFHDHCVEGLRYSYPLIQYKSIDGKAAVVAVGAGADEVGKILRSLDGKVQIGRRTVAMVISDILHSFTDVRLDERFHQYKICRWLPLNQQNFTEYNKIDTLSEKCGMLERVLIGNILSFAKGLGIFFDGQVVAGIQDIRSERQYKYKGVMMLGMDVVFRTNVLLPQYVGLGKGVSLGFGTITEIK